MEISEIFYSIQGEGPKIGEKAIFVRLARCNLRCKFCDSKYAYKGEETGTEEIIDKITGYPCKQIIWTGGEPTLQIKEIVKLIDKLKDYSHNLETNGTNSFPSKLFDIIVISPKKQALSKELIIKYKEEKNVYFKFVIEDKKNYEFWKKLITELGLPKNKIYFMPEATNKEILIEKSKLLIPQAKKDDFNFSNRLQILKDFR